MPKRPSKEPPHDPATEEALRLIEEARKNGARQLDVSDLTLTTLPHAIGQLSQLQQLDLSSNQLSTLPETVQSLERLEKLFLHGNPGLGLPDEVLGPTFDEVLGPQKRSPKPPREILDYYFATRGAKGRALR